MKHRMLAIHFPSPPKEALSKLAEVFFSISPLLGIRPPDLLYLEISSITRLWGGENEIVARLRELFSEQKIAGQVAIADELATAGLLAQSSKHPIVVPTGKSKAALSHLPISTLLFLVNPLSLPSPDETSSTKETLTILSLLGIKTLGEFASLPACAIGSRFGKLGALLHRRAKGEEVLPLHPFSPTQAYRESFAFEEPVANLEPVIFAAKGMFSKLEQRLQKQMETVQKLSVFLETENADEMELEVELLRPLRKEKALLDVFRERISQVTLRSPLLSFAIELSFPIRDRGSQLRLFDREMEQSEKLDELLGRLVGGVGPQFISAAKLRERYRPEASWNSIPFQPELPLSEAPSPTSGERPTYLVSPPEALEREPKQDQLVLRSEKNRYEIVSLEGPERLVGEWWDGKGHARDYYRAATKKGEHLWLFRSLKLPEKLFYLHGFFD